MYARGWSNGLFFNTDYKRAKLKFPLAETMSLGLSKRSCIRSYHNASAILSVGIPEASVLPLSLGELLPDPPAAATGQNGKVSHVLGAEAPGGIAPVSTVAQPAVDGLFLQHQQGILVKQEELQGFSGQDKLTEELRGGDALSRLPPAAQLLQGPAILRQSRREAVSTLAPTWAVPGLRGHLFTEQLQFFRLSRNRGRVVER